MAKPSLAQWIFRAAEAEGLAAAMSDPRAKRAMLVVAANYRRLAEHAAAERRREQGAGGAVPRVVMSKDSAVRSW
jgi:hypothetical protein